MDLFGAPPTRRADSPGGRTYIMYLLVRREMNRARRGGLSLLRQPFERRRGRFFESLVELEATEWRLVVISRNRIVI